MKKIVISSIIVFLISTAVFADLNENDLLFSNETNISLYPEINYEKNPAVLQSIKVPFIFTTFEFDGSYEYEKNVRIDSSVGETGGSEFIYSLSLLPALNFSYFSPGEDGKVFGYDLFYTSEHEISGTDSLDYNDPSENDSLSEVDQVFSGGVNFYIALPGKKTKKNDTGFSLGYELTYDPVYFSWVTDNAVNPTLSYVQTSSEEDDTNEFVHQVNLDYGMVLPKDTFDLSIGVNCTGAYTDRNKKYMPYDSDGDGYNESIALYETYYLLDTEAGGPEDAVSSFDIKDYALTGKINLVGSLVKPVSKEFSIILDGDYHLIDYTYSHYMMHVLESTDETDDSFTDKYYNSSFGSFSATAGAEFSNPTKKSSLKIGVTYSRDAEQYSQLGDESTGLSQYSSLNPGNYTELYLGTEPVNNILSSDDDLYPDESVVQSLGLIGRYEFKPESKTVLFLDFGVSGYYEALTYRAYNLDTRTVWEETDKSAELSWVLESVAGISFPLGEKLKCMLDLRNFGIIGDASIFDETHLYDIDESYLSTEGSVDYSDEFNMSASLDLRFIINL